MIYFYENEKKVVPITSIEKELKNNNCENFFHVKRIKEEPKKKEEIHKIKIFYN